MILQAVLWAVCVLAVVYVLATGDRRPGQSSPWIFALFFISGFPALIYQIVWQRALFLVFGVNIESVTIVVTAFIIGLGFGSLLGGFLSTRRVSPLLLFGAFEIAVGLFGAISLPLFHWVAHHTAALSTLQTAIFSLLLVIVPTLLMGSTLPLLVSYLVTQSDRNVGRSVGKLYFVNTLGSALACFISAQLAMGVLGQSGSVWLACALNAGVGAAVLVILYRQAKELPGSAQPAERRGDSASPATQQTHSPTPHIPFPLALVTAGLVGFIALAYEIVWYRLYSFTLAGRAQSFAMLLGAYLMGIAYGSLVAESLSRQQEESARRLDVSLIGWLIVFFNLIGFLVAPLLAHLVGILGVAAPLIPVGLAAGCLGSTFPLIAHLSVARDRRAGAGVSYLYLSNMMGSALGSFVVGFLLMDVWPVQTLAVGLVILGVAVGLCLVAVSQPRARRLAAVGLLFVAAVVALPPAARILYRHLYERLLYKSAFSASPPFRYVVENKSGVIAVSEHDDTVYGGGVYDGRFNVDPIHDTNLIVRCYAILSVHPSPKNVLMIGLASGSWAQVIANHPAVERLTIVEINPGYLGLIPHYPQVASLLKDPKVNIVIDDGRRWLRRNPAPKFDLIVMNTTFHWRAHTSNLLSVEFLQLVGEHLAPGGILFYNTTSSGRVQLTGTTLFPYALRIMNFLAVSNSPIRPDENRLRDTLLHFRIDGKPLVDPNTPEDLQRLQEILKLAHPGTASDTEQFYSSEYADTIRRRYAKLPLITDDNMGTEWD